jgi:hypothetical protein
VVNLRDRQSPSGTKRMLPESIQWGVGECIRRYLNDGVYGKDNPVTISQYDKDWEYVPNTNWVRWPGTVINGHLNGCGDMLYGTDDTSDPTKFFPAYDLSPTLCTKPVQLDYWVVRKEYLPVMIAHITGIPYEPSVDEVRTLLRLTLPSSVPGQWTYARTSQNCTRIDPNDPDYPLDVFCYMATDDNGDPDPRDLTGEYIATCNPANVQKLLDYIDELESKLS